MNESFLYILQNGHYFFRIIYYLNNEKPCFIQLKIILSMFSLIFSFYVQLPRVFKKLASSTKFEPAFLKLKKAVSAPNQVRDVPLLILIRISVFFLQTIVTLLVTSFFAFISHAPVSLCVAKCNSQTTMIEIKLNVLSNLLTLLKFRNYIRIISKA